MKTNRYEQRDRESLLLDALDEQVPEPIKDRFGFTPSLAIPEPGNLKPLEMEGQPFTFFLKPREFAPTAPKPSGKLFVEMGSLLEGDARSPASFVALEDAGAVEHTSFGFDFHKE